MPLLESRPSMIVIRGHLRAVVAHFRPKQASVHVCGCACGASVRVCVFAGRDLVDAARHLHFPQLLVSVCAWQVEVSGERRVRARGDGLAVRSSFWVHVQSERHAAHNIRIYDHV